MTRVFAFLLSLPASYHPCSVKSHISPCSSNYVPCYLPPTCTAQPPQDSSTQPSPSQSSTDTQPSRNPIAAFVPSLRLARKETLATYGIAAIIAYGLFDAITYTASFFLSLRAYLAAGKTLTWRTLPQVLALMWGINNLSRPFRIAGALALAPFVDRRIIQPLRSFLARRNSDN